MRFLHQLCVSLLAGLLLVACSSSRSVEDLPEELRQTAVVSISGPGSLPPGGSYSFHPGATVLATDPRYDAREIDGLVRKALVRAFADNGWFVAPGSSVTVGYLVALDDPLHEDTVKRILGIDPGLTTTSGHHQRGTLVVELHRTGTNLTLWRGAVQILAEPDLREEVRIERVQRAVDALLARMR